MKELSREFFAEEALKKVVKGDIFAWKNPVITIKTGGRTYGGLSRHIDGLGVRLPDLALGTATFIDPYIFVALWADESSYSAQHIGNCATAILNVAARHGVKLVAIPPLGGIKEGMKHLWVVEQALFKAGDILDDAGQDIPEHVYVRR